MTASGAEHQWRECRCPKRFGVSSLRKELDPDFVIGQGSECGGREVATELPGEKDCVGFTDSEAKNGADVAEDSMGDLRPCLRRVLRHQRQGQAVLAGFGENGDEGIGNEVVVFVHI